MHGYLRPLANFSHVVDTGSITAAANRLGVSPSVISESVKTLEAYFGAPLLERRRSGVVPTSRGEEVAAEARLIVAALDRAIGGSGTEARLEGSLSISLPGEIAATWIASALARVRAAHPGLALTLHIEDTMSDHTKYARDLYLRVTPTPTGGGLTVLARAPVEVSLVGRPTLLGGVDTDDPAAIARLPFLSAVDRQAPVRLALTDVPGMQALRFANVIRVSDIPTRIALARSGVGLVACLAPTVAQDVDAGTFVPLFPGQVGPLGLHAIIGSPHKRPPPKARAVATFLSHALPGAHVAGGSAPSGSEAERVAPPPAHG